jgi:type IV pilus assembly protein PilM
LDIGTSSIRGVEVALNHEPPVLTRLGIIKISPDLVKEGEISYNKGVSDALKELWHKAGFSKKNIILGVANQKVVVRLIDLPFMDEGELQGAIKFQAQDFIPMPVEDVIIDFEIQREYEAKEGERMMKVLLVAAQKEMINGFVSALGGAGLTPKAIDVKSFALVRSLIPKISPAFSEEQTEKVLETICILDIDAAITNMIIAEREMPYFVRILVFGGDELTKALADSFKISTEEAEELKISLSEPEPEGDSKKIMELREKRDKARRILEPKIASFVKEIRRSIDFCLDQTGCSAPERIIVSGRGGTLPILSSDLESTLQVKVEVGKPLQNVKIGKLRISEEELIKMEPSLAVATGLALREAER